MTIGINVVGEFGSRNNNLRTTKIGLMWAPIKKAKEIWSWIDFFWKIAVLLGLVGILTGAAGAAWSVIAGVPLPIAVMAGFCTLVGIIYLGMAPMALRSLTQPRETEIGQTKKMAKPNYTAIRHVEIFSLSAASKLWNDIDPNEGPTLDTLAWLEALEDAVRRKELPIVSRYQEYDRDMRKVEHEHPDMDTKVTKAALKEFAKRHNYDPRFLRDDPTLD